MRIPLTLGSYTDRSVTANCQRCVNLFPRANPEGQPVPFTFYPTPGLVQLGAPAIAGYGRGLFQASNGVLYAVVGNILYQITSSWQFIALGTLQSGVTTPVSMTDNTLNLVCVDGTGNGYTVKLGTGAFSSMATTGFYGGDRVDFVDGFLIFNKPNTGEFYCSLSLAVTFDPLYFATKIGFSDLLVSVAVVHREIWLIGQKTTEIWVNSGATDFPFQIMTGAFIQHGCAAKYSVATMGDAVFWVSQDFQGQSVVVKGQGYQAERISTHAIETALATYPTVTDAVGYTYQQEGHQFYVLNFPTADKTWVYDLATNLWHERVFLDANGGEHRQRVACHAFAYGQHVGLDWETGTLYQISLDAYDDVGNTIIRRRGFPHLGQSGRRVRYKMFMADMEVGRATGTSDKPVPEFDLGTDATVTGILGPDAGDSIAIGLVLGLDTGFGIPPAAPQVWLRWSDTRGASWSNPIAADFGAEGNFLRSIQFQRLGMARDRVFELFWSYPAKTALNGAFIEAETAIS